MPKQSRGIPKEYIKYNKALAKEIGNRVRERRIELKVSQNDLRGKMQLESVVITRSQFSRVENGERLPSASEVIALAASLKVSCGWLLLGHEEGRKK